MSDVGSKPTPRGFDPILFLATGFYFGYAPKAPGTVGSLWGLPLALAIGHIPHLGPLPATGLQAVAIIVICIVGVPLCSEAARRLGGGKDPGAIVFDEIATMPITFFLIPWKDLSGGAWVSVLVLGFVWHRFFDISKPPPCRQAERLDGGLGIMADDCVASVYSALALHGCLWLWSNLPA